MQTLPVYNTNFEIASIIISVVLILFLGMRKKASSFQNRMFLMMIICNMITAVADVAEYYITHYCNNVVVDDILACMYFVTHLGIVALIFFYILANAKEWYQVHIGLKLTFLIPIILGEIFILIDFLFLHTICTYDITGLYTRGPGIYVMYGFVIFYVVSIVSVLIIFGKSFSFQKRIVFIFSMVLICAGVACQFVLISYRLEVFSIVLAEVLYLYFVQNPYNQVDRETNLFNKITFYEMTKENLSKKKDIEFLVVVVENFNDITIGNDENSVACQIAEFLKSIDEYYSVYRIENNVYVIEFEPDSDEEADTIRTLVNDRFEEPWMYGGYKIRYGIRTCHIPVRGNFENLAGIMGIISETVDGSFEKKALDIADFNLAILERGMKIKGALVNAIEKDLFELTFSPIYSRKEKKITGIEISSRFLDSELGYVSEAELMKYVECSSHMIKLGAKLFDKACDFISKYDLKKYGIDFVGIKLNSITCLQYEFITNVGTVFSKYDIDPGFICFQISEYTVSKISNIFQMHMDLLTGMGFRFCLDDYGSGFTNLASIYEFPIDFIQIDSSVVKASYGNAKAKITIESTLDLAKELDMKTIMGGISDEDEFAMVSELICDYEVGSYFYQDVDEKTFMDILEEGGNAT